mgnify:CR=1 FL=1
MINIYQPTLGKEELKAVGEVFKSNWLGKGPKTEEFIKQFGAKLVTSMSSVGFSIASAKNLLTISSCTEGLFQAIDLYIKKGDEVILPSVSFIGAANAIKSKGAIPIFCDCNSRTLNVELEHIESKITNKTKAIIVLHFAGVPCDIERITNFCDKYNIKLIEDNANSPFSKVNAKSTGTYGDIGLWSFDSMKQLVMGDGGMVYCKDYKDKKRLDKLTYMGLESKSGFSNTVDKKWWEFEISSPSRRSITNDIQAAIGIEQLKKIDTQIAKRKLIHDTYTKELGDLDWLLVPPPIKPTTTSSYYMYHIQTIIKDNRDKLAKYLRDKGIYTTFRYYPLHWVGYFNSHNKLPNTEHLAKNTLCIPLHQGLSKKDVKYIISTIKKFK